MRVLATILAALTIAIAAQAGTLDAKLIRASADLQQTDSDLLDFRPKLHKLFGYDHYRQLGHRSEQLSDGARRLLNLGEGFTIFVTPKAAGDKTHTVELEWYSGKVSLIKSTIKLNEKSPVFIKGPEVGKDWIILALTIQP